MKGAPSGDEQLYARVLENVEDGVIALDTEGRITLFNPAVQVFSGLSDRQSRGRRFSEVFGGQEPLLHLVDAALREGRSISDHENILLRRSSLPPLPVSASVSPIFTGQGNQEGAVLILRDLSRVRELEETVRRADRLSMLGTMAAGLAHEIKNPLGGIKGAAQLMEMDLADDSPLREYTQVMVREVERVNGIIEELLDLGHPHPPQMTSVNLAKVLGNIVLFQKEAHRGKEVEFLLHLDPSIPPILGDENLLTRLFLNLVKNAGESIGPSGRIEILTKVASEYHVQQSGNRPVPMIIVEIRDSGCGIPAEELDRIFTPFYTTKTKGSGLGLATCQKIVSEHKGFLKVESTPGEGTQISVYLPFLREAAPGKGHNSPKG